jgi:sugar/nucleoside kinase (ribokinase family)
MNIVILGHLVLDEIHTIDGAVIESVGGITFSLLAFAAFAKPDERLLPVFPYGRDAAQTMTSLAITCPQVDFSNCYAVEEANTRVRLFHDDAAGYNTQLVSSLGPIDAAKIDRLLPEADLVYLNMMTGQDVLPDVASTFKAPQRLVYMDLHMIAYRVEKGGHRQPAAPREWKSWARVADILQCNEKEFNAFLPSGNDDAYRRAMLFDETDLRYLLITRGDRGADIYTPSNENLHVPARSAEPLVDTTGCGDTFGSVFALGIARGDTPDKAAELASLAAASVAEMPGSHGMNELRQRTMEKLR